MNDADVRGEDYDFGSTNPKEEQIRIRIFYRPVREFELLENDVEMFLKEISTIDAEVQFQASNHGLYMMVRYGS